METSTERAGATETLTRVIEYLEPAPTNTDGQMQVNRDGLVTMLHEVRHELERARQEIHRCHNERALAPGLECRCDFCAPPND